MILKNILHIVYQLKFQIANKNNNTKIREKSEKKKLLKKEKTRNGNRK